MLVFQRLFMAAFVVALTTLNLFAEGEPKMPIASILCLSTGCLRLLLSRGTVISVERQHCIVDFLMIWIKRGLRHPLR